MKPSELLQYAVIATIIGLIVLLLFSQLLGQPFLVFVETGSMSPTLEPNDGYVAVPSFFAGEIEEGDVILFMSQEIEGGELTTHRVVGETEEGYITQGDANPFTDQDGDEPPVAEGQIRSVAVQMNDDMVVIPGLGATVGSMTAVTEGFQSSVLQPLGIDTDVTTISTAILVGGLALFIISTVTASADKRARSRSKGSILQNAVVVIAILTLVVIIPLNFSMLLPSGVYQYEILSSTSPTDDEQIIQAGESSDVTYAMRNSGHLPTLVFLEPAGDGVDIHEEQTYVPRRTTVETSITMHAPEETGTYFRFVREHRYLVVLPPSLIATLHAIHPIVAIAAINLWVGAIVITISVLSVGTDRVRLRSRRRELSIGDEIRRKMPIVSVNSSRRPPSPNEDTGGGLTFSALLGDDGPPDPPSSNPPPTVVSSLPDDALPDDARPGGPPDDARAESTPDQPPAGSDEDEGGEFVFGEPNTANSGSDGFDTGGFGSDDFDADGFDASGFGAGEFDSEWDEIDGDELTDAQLIEVHNTLQEPPTAAGIDAERWKPALLCEYLADEYGLTYPRDRAEQLMKRSGVDPNLDE